MSEFLFNYQRVDPTTWVYLSSLLSLGLFFKFNRFWSVRNLDLVLLILLAPGLLLVHYGRLEQGKIVDRVAKDQLAKDQAAATQASRNKASDARSLIAQPGTPSGLPLTRDPSDENTAAPDEATSGEPDNSSDTAGQPAAAALDAPVEDTGTEDAGAEVTGAEDAGANRVAEDAGSKDAGSETAVGPMADQNAEGDVGSEHKKFQNMQAVEFSGFLWLIIVNAFLVVRLLVDPNMVRRPLLEPNLSSGGLTFICVSLFVFLMANVIASAPASLPSELAQQARRELAFSPEAAPDAVDEVQRPGYILLMLFPRIPTTPLTAQNDAVTNRDVGAGNTAEVDSISAAPASLPRRNREDALVTAARCIAIISHLAIVLGIATVGYRHFDSLKTGIGAATLYLMLPYTAQMTGHIEHSIPAALLVWAVVFYRRPATAGVFLGLCMGCYYYPLFLLPLWISFYWQRGLGRFLGGIFSMLALLVALLLFKSDSPAEFFGHLRTMFGAWTPLMNGLEGVWGLGWDPWYRVPVLAFFIGISSTLAIWPAQKNLGTLISCSGAVMVATQFWHGFGGGIYMGWFLPLLLLTIFRPNLEDRIALSVLGEGWFPRRKRMAA